MNQYNLPEKQQKVLDIIISYLKTVGYPPSIREIKSRSGINSLRGVTLQLDSLEETGFIQRKQKARGIIVSPALLSDKQETFSIPLKTCSISCGPASDADDYSDETINVSLLQTRGLKNVFAVKAVGDSMVNENIHEGDIAIIFPQPVANDKEIVATRIPQQGVTLKKYRIVEGKPILFPSSPNPTYKPYFGDFEIQGKLINILKPNG